MDPENRKYKIQESINNFSKNGFAKDATAFLDVLGYRSDRHWFVDVEVTPNNLAEFFHNDIPFNNEKALTDQWISVNLLFQLTGENIVDASQGRLAFEDRSEYNPAIYQSYLFFAVELTEGSYTRSQLSSITREINKLFLIPVMVLFKHNESLTLSIINRRPHKREEHKDVLEKVTLIKDISIKNPHRAHIEILFDLSLEELHRQHDISNFLELHKAWQVTLDASELNKRFFKELANWYFWAVLKVTFPGDAGEDEESRNATSVIRLITRLIFIWFIKEKGLVPDILFDERRLVDILDYEDPNDSTYYKAILQNLFFATLNREMNSPEKPDNRKFRGKASQSGGRDQHYMIHNVYRYENCFKNSEEALQIFENIPFLNGGLFECLDRLAEDNSNRTLRIDGFSDRSDNPIRVPDYLFFGEEQEVDLNEAYGTKNKRYKVCGLIRILNRYKFTIEENTPIDEEVALDPELLGRVFENLLAAYNPETGTTARKQTGSFYTPREIVNYMVDESLIAYLRMKLLGDEKDEVIEQNIETRLRQLFEYNEIPHQFSEEEVTRLIDAIDHVNVLDPAVGSGAFPMGVLQKLVYVLSILDPGNKQWKEKQIEKVIQIPDSTIREAALLDIEEAFTENELDYGRKLFLIENCIYGVDIQPIAVQIAKLRFFITLVVDQIVNNAKPNRGVRPLPNLETKFISANTLIALEKPEQMVFKNPEIEVLEKELAYLRKKHFNARTLQTKNRYRDLDKTLREQIGVLLEKDGFKRGTTELLVRWNPYDQNCSSPFFDSEWMFGISSGFDIIIGNPPYMRVQGIQQTQPEYMPYYREHYQSARGSFDLYALFIECGYQLLAPDGQFAYIVPHKFFQAAFGEALRRLLTKQRALRQIVRFGSAQVFEESTTYTCLLFLSAQPNNEFDLLEVKTLARGEEVLQAARERSAHPDYAYERLVMPSLESNDQLQPWNFAVGGHQRILQRLRQHPLTIGNITRKIFQGLATSADKIYVLQVREEREDTLMCYSQYMDEVVEIERGLVKPFLMGKDVHRYEPVVAPNVVIFPYEIRDGRAELMSQDYIQNEFPLGWNYLLGHQMELAKREHGRFAIQWHAFSRPQNLTEFGTVKIITPEIALGCQMTLDSKGEFYHTTKVYSFAFNNKANSSLQFYLGLLNSKLLWYFLTSTGYILRGGYYTFKTNYLKPFPIAEYTPEQERAIETLVDYVLHLKAQPEPSDKIAAADLRVMTAYYEQLIDALVYEMYFPEEFEESGKYPSRFLTHRSIPVIKELLGDKTIAFHEIFQRLYNPKHPVRDLIFFLDSLETIRIIEAKSKLS